MLSLVPPTLPDLCVIVTPNRNDDWSTGASAVVVDRRNSAVVAHKKLVVAADKEHADVQINAARLRLPVHFSPFTR